MTVGLSMMSLFHQPAGDLGSGGRKGGPCQGRDAGSSSLVLEFL